MMVGMIVLSAGTGAHTVKIKYICGLDLKVLVSRLNREYHAKKH